jgi:hypothetical protein
MPFIKIIVACLTLIGLDQVDAAWKKTQTVLPANSEMGTYYEKDESSFSSSVQKYGFVNLVKFCQDTFDAVIQWDIEDICDLNRTLDSSVFIGFE